MFPGTFYVILLELAYKGLNFGFWIPKQYGQREQLMCFFEKSIQKNSTFAVGIEFSCEFSKCHEILWKSEFSPISALGSQL